MSKQQNIKSEPRIIQPVKTTAKQSSVAASRVQQKKVKWELPFEKQNFIWIGIGVLFIIVGYLCMATGVTEEPAVLDGKWNNPLAITVAPFLLVIGYCVVIPYGILKVFKKTEVEA